MICLRLPARQLAAIFGGLSLAVRGPCAAYAADAVLVRIENFAFTATDVDGEGGDHRHLRER